YWSVKELKDLTGRSASNFPASRYHTEAARHRKASRLVSLRLDYLYRHHGEGQEDEESYYFADYGPAGGQLIGLCYGPPSSVVRVTKLSETEASILAKAADPGDAGIKGVDKVLIRHLKESRSECNESQAKRS
ncbi:MAG: hypothetical protein P1V97_33490, partial [Planctomycetota bacterium]|nr:hypothetical protein [Planctomycetota bacterium]